MSSSELLRSKESPTCGVKTLPIAYLDLISTRVVLSMHVEVGEFISEMNIGTGVMIPL